MSTKILAEDFKRLESEIKAYFDIGANFVQVSKEPRLEKGRYWLRVTPIYGECPKTKDFVFCPPNEDGKLFCKRTI